LNWQIKNNVITETTGVCLKADVAIDGAFVATETGVLFCNDAISGKLIIAETDF